MPDSAKAITVIEPRKGWSVLQLRELVQYRDLLYFLVWRDITVLYRQTVLGFGWAILRPAISMVIFSVIFGRLAQLPSDGVPYPLFVLAGLVPWTYFSTALSKCTDSLVGSAGMLTKVYFPRVFVPLTPVLAGLVDMAVAGLLLAALMLWYGTPVGWHLMWIPIPLLVMLLTTVATGLWLSALAIQYRDVKHVAPFLVQILMYAAPVVWPVSLIAQQLGSDAEWIRWLYGLYPMAGVIEGMRAALLGSTQMPWDLLLSGSLSALALAVSGAFYFRTRERIFADVA